jgi:hypothetical protein
MMRVVKPLRHRLEGDPLERADDGQFVEAREIPGKLRIIAIDLGEPVELCTTVPTASVALDPLAVAEIVTANDLWSDEDIIWMLGEAAFRIANEAESFAGDLHDAFARAKIFLAHVVVPAGVDGKVVIALGAVIAITTIMTIIRSGRSPRGPRSLRSVRSRRSCRWG